VPDGATPRGDETLLGRDSSAEKLHGAKDVC
jgi:hypothetical protein